MRVWSPPGFMLLQLDGTYSVRPDVQLAGAIENHLPRRGRRPDHLWVSELSNPAQAYHDRLGLAVESDPALHERLEVGNIMHGRFASAARSVAGVHANEATLDGAFVDLPGIVGRIDLRHEDALLEFKTTPYEIETEDDVWNMAPQYAAQLLVYAAIWTRQSRRHLLAIMPIVDRQVRPLRVFDMEIQDLPRLKRQVAVLRDLLANAIEKGDPIDLGRCSYAGNLCPYEQAGICHCGERESHIQDWLGRGVSMVRNYAMEEALQTAWDGKDRVRGLHPWELTVPRRYYAMRTTGVDHFTSGQASPDRIQARKVLRRALVAAGLTAPPGEVAALPRPAEPAPEIGFAWLRVPKTRRRETVYRLAPAVLREWTTDQEPQPTHPRVQWSARQATSVAAYHGLSTAFVVLHAPRLAPPVRVMAVTVEDQGAARDGVVQAVHRLRQAVEGGDDEPLPACPEFTRGDCPVQDCRCS